MPSAGVLLHRLKWRTGELLHGVLLLEYCCWITAAFSVLKAVTVQQLAAPTLLQRCCWPEMTSKVAAHLSHM